MTNAGAAAVTELEILEGKTIVGEVENVAPGLTRSFSLTLRAGAYTLFCPGGTAAEGTLTVTGEAVALGTDARKAVETYRDYLKEQTALLSAATRAFADAVTAGDVASAKRLYPAARAPYERIEPVAESFGDLDPAIDAREDDVATGEQWTGFHRIEKAL